MVLLHFYNWLKIVMTKAGENEWKSWRGWCLAQWGFDGDVDDDDDDDDDDDGGSGAGGGGDCEGI